MTYESYEAYTKAEEFMNACKEIESLRAQLTAAQAENERLAAGLLHISDTTDDPELAQWAFRYVNGSAGIAAKGK